MKKVRQQRKPSGGIRAVLCHEQAAGYVFIAPFIIGFMIFTIIPIIASFLLAFTDYDILSKPSFIGLDNFIKMFTADSKFIKSLEVTFFYAVVSTPLRLLMALVVAMILVRPSKLSAIYRAVYYLPSIIGGSVAVAVMWKQIFSSDGVINALLMSVGIPCEQSWLGNKNTAIWVLILLSVWQFGSSMLIFLAGLKQIPRTLYEAAIVDGAGKIQSFFKITLPLLTPTIFFNLVMQTINGFMAFTQSYIITGGKPLNSTLFYAFYLYQKAFTNYDMGYACAMAWVLLVIVASVTAILFKSSGRWVYYESKE